MATQDLERFQFHGAISRIMELVNTLYLYIQDVPVRDQNRQALEASLNTVVQLVAPFAPHFGEELWRQLGHHDSVFLSVWPSWDERVLRTDTVQMVVQINGKVRGQIDAARDAGEAALKTLVAENEKFKKYLEGREIVKFVVVKNKLVSIAVRE
jgi:leucyl-tRNA synthetase